MKTWDCANGAVWGECPDCNKWFKITPGSSPQELSAQAAEKTSDPTAGSSSDLTAQPWQDEVEGVWTNDAFDAQGQLAPGWARHAAWNAWWTSEDIWEQWPYTQNLNEGVEETSGSAVVNDSSRKLRFSKKRRDRFHQRTCPIFRNSCTTEESTDHVIEEEEDVDESDDDEHPREPQNPPRGR